jgi:hypothetical protein
MIADGTRRRVDIGSLGVFMYGQGVMIKDGEDGQQN